MPRIQEYESRVRSAGPIDGPQAHAADFGNAGLSHLGAAVSEAGDIFQKRAEQSEISDLHAKISQTHADFTTYLADTTKNTKPGDPNLVQNVMDKYDEHMSKMGESIDSAAARNYFTKANAELRAHFVERSASSQAELSGIKAVQDYTSSLRNLSSSLINDPSSYQMAAKLHADGLEQIAGRLPPEKAAQLKEQGETELAKSAIRGWIGLNPDLAKEQLKSGKWNGLIDGDLKHQMFGEADQAVRAKEAEDRRQQEQQLRVLEQKREVTRNDFLQKMQDGQLNFQDIMKSNLDSFGSGSKETFIKMMDKDSNKTDPATFRELYSRIHLNDGDPKKLMNEDELNNYVVGGKLSYEDLNHLRGEMQGLKTSEGKVEGALKSRLMKVAEQSLVKSNPMLGIQDAEGEQQLLKFQLLFDKTFEAQRKEGKSALQLLDPSSPDYLGRYIRNFSKTPQQVIQDNMRSAGFAPSKPQISPSNANAGGTTPPAAPPSPSANDQSARRAGESAEAYLKRHGK